MIPTAEIFIINKLDETQPNSNKPLSQTSVTASCGNNNKVVVFTYKQLAVKLPICC